MVALPARIADSASVSCFFWPLRSALCPSATMAFSAFCLKSAAERSALRLWPAVFLLLFFSKCFRRPLFKSAAPPGRCRSPPPRQRDRPGGTCVQIHIHEQSTIRYSHARRMASRAVPARARHQPGFRDVASPPGIAAAQNHTLPALVSIVFVHPPVGRPHLVLIDHRARTPVRLVLRAANRGCHRDGKASDRFRCDIKYRYST